MKSLIAALLLAMSATSAANLFDSHEPLAITLAGPITETIADRTDEPQQHEFVVGVDGIEVPLQVRTRGKFRKKNCSFPPLRLNFKKKAELGSPFDGQDKLKLVTHCERGRTGKHNVVEEYLVYRFFNLLTDKSYRVRWLNVQYPELGDATFVGFVIESKEALAERLGATLLELPDIDPETFDPEFQAFAAVFQYAVGNADYSFIGGPDNCCHNSTPLELPSGVFPIPYDFDRTSLVGASYLTGSSKSREPGDASDREYRGYCVPEEVWHRAATPVRESRRAFYDLVDELPDISGFARTRAKRYMDGFYAEMRRKDGIHITQACR